MTKSHTALPLPPKEYDPNYFNRLIKQLDVIFNRMESTKPLRGASDKSRQNVNYPISGLTIEDIPTSATGLPSGSVWSDGGILKIVS